MGYKIKWVTEHTGVTRDMIREYEKRGLIERKPEQKIRDYSEEEVRWLFWIKFLIEIGFSMKTIKSFMEDEDSDFQEELKALLIKKTDESKELEKKIRFLETAVLSGKLPNIKDFGSLPVAEFMEGVFEEWNYPVDVGLTELWKIQELSKKELTEEDLVDALGALLPLMKQYTQFLQDKNAIKNKAYLEMIIELDEDYRSESIQKIVEKIYQLAIKMQTEPPEQLMITPQNFARNIAPTYMIGELGKLKEYELTKDECKKIADAISFFAGFDSFDAMMKYYYGEDYLEDNTQ